MRRYISILIVAISIAATSCNNFLVKEESTPPEGAFVTLAVGKTGSRTILPESYDEVASLVNFTFTATSTAGEEVTKTFTDYDTLQTAQLFFTPGIYDCKLSATSTGGIKYEGVLEDTVIAPGDNTLAFKLQAVQLSTEPGSVEVQLTFPGTNVAVVKAGLYSIAGEALDGFPEEVLEITSGNTVTYNKDEVPGGSHLVQFSFYGDAEYRMFLGMHTEVIVIVSGKKSAATRSIEAINPMYTITYELNGGNFVEGYTAPEKFTSGMELQLPKTSEIRKSGMSFFGWYTDAAFTGSPVYSLPWGTCENKVYYAKWGTFTAETIDVIDLRSVAGDYDLVISGPITSDTISTLKSKISAAGTSAKIHLDLSPTTGLTSIGDDAFYGCSGLTSVEIPSSVTSIGSLAFSYCSGLTSVEIPASVTSIGSSAFSGCSGLTVYYQGDLARWCEGFEGRYTLMGYCRNLYINGELVQGDLVIPDGVTSIGYDAFEGCSGLTSVEIPASVTSIGGRAFRGCSGLTSVEIPASVTSIGSDAFDGCSGLTSVTFGAGSQLKSIGSRAFYGCTGLTSVGIPASVTSIGSDAFDGCSGLTSVTFGAGSQLKSIGSRAFYRCTGLTSVEIPASVTSIDDYAFLECSGLTSVTFGAGSQLKSIGSRAFYRCTGLTSVEIPASVTSIGDNAFYGCTGLTSVYYQGDLARWCEGFAGRGSLMTHCENLYINGELVQGDLVIPDGVTSIGESAFEGCSRLTSVEIPAGVVDSGLFPAVTGECRVVVTGEITGSTVKKLSSMIHGMSAGAKIRLDLSQTTGLTSIGDYAFDGCSRLTSVTFGEGSQLESIGYMAFAGCTGLTSVEIPASVTSIRDSAFSGCSGLSSVEIPASVTSIGDWAFSGCSGLSSVEIPASVTFIGDYAFYGCSGLTSVEIPASVTSIGWNVFRFCWQLTSVTFGDTSGWYITTSETGAANKTGGTAVTLSSTDLAANARLVTGSTYYEYYWYKVD